MLLVVSGRALSAGPLIAVALLTAGCFGGGGSTTAHPASIPSHGGPFVGDLDGQIDASGYRGAVKLCPTRGSFGPRCKVLAVDNNGHFHTRLESMMWKLTPKPAANSRVTIPSKTFAIGGGETLTLTLHGSHPQGWVISHSS